MIETSSIIQFIDHQVDDNGESVSVFRGIACESLVRNQNNKLFRTTQNMKINSEIDESTF